MKLFLPYILLCCFSFTKAQSTGSDTLLAANKIPPSDSAYRLLAKILKDTRPELSLIYLRKALAAERNKTSSVAIIYTYAGWAFRRIYLYDSSNFYYEKALVIYKSLNDNKGISLANRVIGMNFQVQGIYDKAIEYISASVSSAIRINDTLNLIKASVILGAIYKDQKEYKLAEKILNETLEMAREINDSIDVAQLLNTLGVTYRKQNNLDRSIECFKEGLIISQRIKNIETIGYHLSNLGVSYEKKKMFDTAQKYNLLALALREKTNDKFGITQCLMNIGNIYYWKKDYKQYIHYQEKALVVAKEINSLHNIKDIYYNLAYAYSFRALNVPAEELKYFKMHVALRDSLHNAEIDKKIAKAETVFEYEKKIALDKLEQKAKDELAAQKFKSQLRITFAFAASTLLLLILAIYIYRSYAFKKKATALLEKQKQEIKVKGELVAQSIDYARRIQNAFIQGESVIQQSGKEYFIINQPKDIVSGDFLWSRQNGDVLLFAIADSTGHGVPGAFMSLVGYHLLQQSSTSVSPANLLKNLLHNLDKALSPATNGVSYDGIEILIGALNLKTNEFLYSGTRQRFCLCRQGKVSEYRTNNTLLVKTSNQVFNTHRIQLIENDVLFLFTDGYPDQKGSESKRKLYYEPFMKLLEIRDKEPLTEKQQFLLSYFLNWKKDEEQTDDILVFGLKI